MVTLFLLSIIAIATFGRTPITVEEIKLSNDEIYPNDEITARPEETVCMMTRDNVCLSTDIYYATTGKKPWPCVYAKTPYGKSSLSSTASQWVKNGYCFIGQDSRGRHQSNGSYSFWRTSGNDTLDTIQWMLQSPQTQFSDGLAGVTGVSADALAQYADIPGIWVGGGGTNGFNHYNQLMNHGKVGYLIWGDGLGRQTAYQSGAYRTGLISGWLDLILEPGMVHTVLENEAFDAFWYPLVGNWTAWDTTNHPNQPVWSLTNLTIVHSSGWYDIFSTNQMGTAFGVNNTGQINAKGKQILIVDPGGHCGGGAIKWPNASYAANIMDSTYGPAIFNGAVQAAQKNELFDVHQYVPWNTLFYMLGSGLKGEEGLYWIASKGFPAYTSLSYYMDGTGGNDAGSLSTTKATKNGGNSYLYDPKDPVRTHGGNNLIIEPCGPQNQQHNENGRKDILHYTSGELTQDIAIVGLITAELYVGSDAIDTDFTAKLIDVFPDGTAMLVQDGILRMRWRNGPYQTNVAPEMKKGQVYGITVDIGYMAYIFSKGHKISISVSSSNYKRFSINYNNGNFVVDGDKNPITANNTVYFGSNYPSRLVLPQVDLQWIQQRKVDL